MDLIQDQKYYRDTGRIVYNDSVKRNVAIMMDSSECRKKIMKDGMTLDPWEIIEILSQTLSDIVGDTVFKNKMERIIEARRSKT